MKLNNEDSDYLAVGNGWFYIPKDLFKTMVPEEYDPSDGIIVEVEDYKTDTAVKEFLQRYADSDPHLKLTCFSDVVNDGRSNYYLVMGLVWGLILAVKNIMITAVFGTAAGYAMIQIMREFQATYLHWHFPVWCMLGYIAMVLVVPVLISAVITNILQKKTLVERLREAE